MNLTCSKIPEDTFLYDVAQSDLVLHCLPKCLGSFQLALHVDNIF